MLNNKTLYYSVEVSYNEYYKKEPRILTQKLEQINALHNTVFQHSNLTIAAAAMHPVLINTQPFTVYYVFYCVYITGKKKRHFCII